jgi:methionyl-tRNA formyltransferase
MKVRPNLPGYWSVCISPDDLNALLTDRKPRYIFFLHWSSVVPDSITEAYPCVCFHMTDLPYGRGGSPLQNLIVRGHKSTMLTAIRMTTAVDAGPIYFKRPLNLEGSAKEVFERASELSTQMMAEIVCNDPEPVPQEGEATVFVRRKPSQSELPKDLTAETLYDHIRMLDAPGYPPAFLRYGSWVAKFTQARLADNVVEAQVRFEKVESL